MNFGELSHLTSTQRAGVRFIQATIERASDAHIKYIYQWVRNILKDASKGIC
jgi:hypothetical protein